VGADVGRPPVFDLVTTRADDQAVVRVVGELDAASGPRLHDELDALARGGIPRVTVDLAKLTFISSSGLGVLVTALTRVREMGGELCLQGLSPLATKVFGMTGLSSLFPVSTSGGPS